MTNYELRMMNYEFTSSAILCGLRCALWFCILFQTPASKLQHLASILKSQISIRQFFTIKSLLAKKFDDAIFFVRHRVDTENFVAVIQVKVPALVGQQVVESRPQVPDSRSMANIGFKYNDHVI